jgi:hypothetical protein
MDNSPEVAAALTIIRDECLSKNERGNIMEIYSQNERVREILKDLFKNKLNAEYNMKMWIREMCKFGDFFLHLHIDGLEKKGVYDVMALPQEEIHRQEGVDGIAGNTRFYWDTRNLYFEEWQVAHFRLLDDARRYPYGRSILDPARKLWKQLQLAEDAMLTYRLCLDGKTRIPTTDGYKFIKDIKVGDFVYSYTENGDLIENKVINHECNGVKKMVNVKTKNSTITCTPTHPILIKRNVFLNKEEEVGGVLQLTKHKVEILKYVDAKDLVVGEDQIILFSDDLKTKTTEDIVSVEYEKDDLVYDITVENNPHNFIANGIPVHNTRAPERRIFYIDVGAIDDADVKQYIEQIKTSIKKQPIVDVRTGQVNLKFNPASYEEDFFIPVRGDKSSKIETLPGASNLDQIQDLEYLERKLFAALQVPKPYLNYTESMPGGSMLAQADLRFSRMINSIQESVIMELRRIANIHLLFMGYDDELDNFTITLTNPSTQQELLNLETWKTRLEVFKELFNAEVSAPVSYTWAMENILGFSKEEIKLILKQKKVEKKIFAEIESAVETYKKVGLFYDLDKKFEKEESVGSEGMDIGGGEQSLDMGGETGGMDVGTETPAETPEAPAEVPLSERNKFVKRVLKESDARFEEYYNELLGENKKEEIKSVLLENNSLANTKTHKLRESMNKMNSLIERRKVESDDIELDMDQIEIKNKSNFNDLSKKKIKEIIDKNKEK